MSDQPTEPSGSSPRPSPTSRTAAARARLGGGFRRATASPLAMLAAGVVLGAVITGGGVAIGSEISEDGHWRSGHHKAHGDRDDDHDRRMSGHHGDRPDSRDDDDRFGVPGQLPPGQLPPGQVQPGQTPPCAPWPPGRMPGMTWPPGLPCPPALTAPGAPAVPAPPPAPPAPAPQPAPPAPPAPAPVPPTG